MLLFYSSACTFTTHEKRTAYTRNQLTTEFSFLGNHIKWCSLHCTANVAGQLNCVHVYNTWKKYTHEISWRLIYDSVEITHKMMFWNYHPQKESFGMYIMLRYPPLMCFCRHTREFWITLHIKLKIKEEYEKSSAFRVARTPSNETFPCNTSLKIRVTSSENVTD